MSGAYSVALDRALSASDWALLAACIARSAFVLALAILQNIARNRTKSGIKSVKSNKHSGAQNSRIIFFSIEVIFLIRLFFEHFGDYFDLLFLLLCGLHKFT